MRIYIIGPVAAGKTTLANHIGSITNTPVFHLDELVHIPDSTSHTGNNRRPDKERDAMFTQIITRPNWIIEDVGRDCFSAGISAADLIIFLDPSIGVRYKRILSRFLRQRLRLEPCNYAPNLNMLISMFRWTREYNTDNKKQYIRTKNCNVKTLHTQTECTQWLNTLALHL